MQILYRNVVLDFLNYSAVKKEKPNKLNENDKPGSEPVLQKVSRVDMKRKHD